MLKSACVGVYQLLSEYNLYDRLPYFLLCFNGHYTNFVTEHNSAVQMILTEI